MNGGGPTTPATSAASAEMVIRGADSADFARFRLDDLAPDTPVWVVDDPQPCGYAALIELPGLPQERELRGLVLPAQRRRGLGRTLLACALEWARAHRLATVSCGIADLDAPAAHFLRRHGFAAAHEEWTLRHETLGDVPPATVALRRVARAQAVQLLPRLYDASFRGRAWYQPYETVAEVRQEMGPDDDFMVLERENRPIAFGWVRYPEPGLAELEPVGVVADYQGQGFGRRLIVALLQHARGRGCSAVRLGVRGDNAAAVALYHSVGFRHVSTLTYFSRSVAQPLPA